MRARAYLAGAVAPAPYIRALAGCRPGPRDQSTRACTGMLPAPYPTEPSLSFSPAAAGGLRSGPGGDTDSDALRDSRRDRGPQAAGGPSAVTCGASGQLGRASPGGSSPRLLAAGRGRALFGLVPLAS